MKNPFQRKKSPPPFRYYIPKDYVRSVLVMFGKWQDNCGICKGQVYYLTKYDFVSLLQELFPELDLANRRFNFNTENILRPYIYFRDGDN
jgi:hypothetical protein